MPTPLTTAEVAAIRERADSFVECTCSDVPRLCDDWFAMRSEIDALRAEVAILRDRLAGHNTTLEP